MLIIKYKLRLNMLNVVMHACQVKRKRMDGRKSFSMYSCTFIATQVPKRKLTFWIALTLELCLPFIAWPNSLQISYHNVTAMNDTLESYL